MLHCKSFKIQGHSRSQGSNINISFKLYNLKLQTTCDDDMSWSYDATSVGVYGGYTNLGSKVIKGSFLVRIQKSLKIHICEMQYSTLRSFGQMKEYSLVLPQLTQIWGQRSFKVIAGACRSSSGQIQLYLNI